jgi:hypothetical protein
MTNIPKKMTPIPAEQYDIMTLKVANMMKDQPNVKLLATHIAEIATILDRMKFHAGSGWEDQATVCAMATMRMMAQLQAAGDPMAVKGKAALDKIQDEIKAANDNDDDMKMAA